MNSKIEALKNQGKSNILHSALTCSYNAGFPKPDRKVPILKGCMAAKNGGCFCNGSCKEIIGYRDKLPNEI